MSPRRKKISARGMSQAWFLLGALFFCVSVFFVSKDYLDNAIVGAIIFSIGFWAVSTTRRD
jgi:hypothetical protein